jgi:hypothetical protein
VQRWEYMTIRFFSEHTHVEFVFLGKSSSEGRQWVPLGSLERSIANLGKAGWEMFATQQWSPSGNVVYYFKRPIEEAPE